MARRGRHRIYLGMAAGVGKTYRMLQEGQAEAEAGRDVVIGYLEPHDRAETAAQAEGLELIPRRYREHRGSVLAEMDLPRLIARAPELALIDEIAHTNAPGVEHAKRYEDVEQVLSAGIDVFSTLNVQHLESLNDQVADLTTVRVRETLPDEVLKRADEVLLIDLTPADLIERLRAGKVYGAERIESALSGFFKVENLAALRELALREVAEEVESKRQTETALPPDRDRLIDAAVPQAVAERLLALVTPEPRSQRLIRRAWRSAQRLGAELDLLWVAPPGAGEEPGGATGLAALRRLAAVLGAHLIVERGEDLPSVARRVALDRGTTYVLLGAPGRRRGPWPFRRTLLDRLVEELPGIDIRVVADRARRPERGA